MVFAVEIYIYMIKILWILTMMCLMWMMRMMWIMWIMWMMRKVSSAIKTLSTKEHTNVNIHDFQRSTKISQSKFMWCLFNSILQPFKSNNYFIQQASGFERSHWMEKKNLWEYYLLWGTEQKNLVLRDVKNWVPIMYICYLS